MDQCRLSGLAFDVDASAGWYSAIAGLLAGLPFVAVPLPLDHEVVDDESDRAGDGVVVFVSAAPVMLAKAVLGFTAGVVGWSAVVLPLLPSEVVISAAFEHASLTLTAIAVVLFSALTWAGTTDGPGRGASS